MANVANRRGLTDAERELFELLHDRLAVARDRVNFALHENTVDHAMPSINDLEQIWFGVVVLRAMLREPVPAPPSIGE